MSEPYQGQAIEGPVFTAAGQSRPELRRRVKCAISAHPKRVGWIERSETQHCRIAPYRVAPFEVANAEQLNTCGSHGIML